MKKVQLLSKNKYVVLLPLLLLLAVFLFPKPTPEEEAKNIVSSCKKTKSEETCYAEMFSKIAKHHKLEYSLEVLSFIRKENAHQEGCHFIAHVIAAEEIKKNPANWVETIANMPVNECTGGFIMGAIEGYNVYDKHFELNAKIIPQLCERVKDVTKKKGSDQTCVHTSGHLLLIDTLGNVAKAIAACNALSSHYRYECASGVFMENIFRRNLLAHGIGKGLVWNEETFSEQKRMCGAYEGIIAKGCWRELSHMIIDLSDKDSKKISERCAQAEDESLQNACQNHALQVLMLLK